MEEPNISPDRASRIETVKRWNAVVEDYKEPNAWRASWQILNSVGSYAVLWYLMYLSLAVGWWLTLPLAVLGGGLLVRIFIIFHDCGHGSFFRSGKANDFWGFVTGMLSFTPYYHWRWEHSIHHASAGHLERRGVGDIWTLTVEEYLASSPWTKFSYRLARDPVVLFVIAPIFIFLVVQRFPKKKAKLREKVSVWTMNALLVTMSTALILVFGFIPWLVIQLVIIGVGSSAGVWLFYVQHQFEDAYWEGAEEWDYTAAAMRGSSFYRLPRVLQWFSGNIGYHHIHHLSPRIPNYNLERCHASDPMFQEVQPISLFGSFKTLAYRLWDEKEKKLISFRQMKRKLAMAAKAAEESAGREDDWGGVSGKG